MGVVGSGTMATGIIEVFAKAGFSVTFVARSEDKVAKVIASIRRSLEKALQRGKIEQDAVDAAMGCITGTTVLDDLADVDLVVEAIAEELDIKTALFENLDEICRAGGHLGHDYLLLARGRSCVGDIAPRRRRRASLLQSGAVMKLVEIVDTVATSSDVVATARSVVCLGSAKWVFTAVIEPVSL